MILSSTALCGLIVTLTFIFSVKAIGHVVHYVYLHKVYLKQICGVFIINAGPDLLVHINNELLLMKHSGCLEHDELFLFL